jgi:hypothetical protein
MSIMIAVGLFLLAAVGTFVGTMFGGAVNFRSFGSSGVGLIGSGISFTACLTVAVMGGGGVLTWVFVGLTSLIFGVIMRGAAR